jgi:acetoin utilization deacetylase AcuC-like enzyme
VFNDSAIAALTLQAEGKVRRVAILDCDVHQGNDTAAILADDPTIFALSIHGANNFPFEKQESDLDIELPDSTGDRDYLAAVDAGGCHALSASQPDLAIYLAGADPFEGDGLGRLAITKTGLADRDRVVFELCKSAGVAVAIAMAGGYARRIEDSVDIHLTTVRTVAELLATG